MRKAQEIQVISSVELHGEAVRFADLPPQERRRAATELKLAYLNELYCGRAVFFRAEAEGPDGAEES